MLRLRLIHWNEGEAAERAARLEAAGYRVDHAPFDPASFRALKQRPPDAVVIDLGRLPSHGRDVALGLRGAGATRHLPLVFVGGEEGKVAPVRKLLPDAVFASWRGVREALRTALTRPPENPVVPATALAGYSGTPLPRKLGIKPGMRVALAGAPAGFEKTLGMLPDDVRLASRASRGDQLILWFVRSARELETGIDRMAHRVGEGGGLWIAWPKKASGVATDVNQGLVRRAGLGRGLVDYKICAIDGTWSGLKFAPRRA